MVRILLWEGQDVNEVTTRLGNTPLHIAARNGHYLVCKYLVESGADLNIGNNQPLTPAEYLNEALTYEPDKVADIKKKLKGKTSAAFEAAKQKLKLMQDTQNLLQIMAKGGARK